MTGQDNVIVAVTRRDRRCKLFKNVIVVFFIFFSMSVLYMLGMTYLLKQIIHVPLLANLNGS